jgi:hypothetical protein
MHVHNPIFCSLIFFYLSPSNITVYLSLFLDNLTTTVLSLLRNSVLGLPGHQQLMRKLTLEYHDIRSFINLLPYMSCYRRNWLIFARL